MPNTALTGGSTSGERAGSASALALYTIIAVSLMIADHHGGFLDRVRGWLSYAAYPIVQIVHWPIRSTRATAEFFAERSELQARMAMLEQRWLSAQADLLRLASLEQENRRLRALLESSERLRDQVQVAELKSVDLDPFSHRIVIDRGAGAGVYLGQPLADASGIIGQIERVLPLTAYARLITDPSHAIPVALNRTGLRTIAYGTGQTDRLVMRDVPRSADIQVGDLLVSSGLGGRFPVGLPVATVSAVDLDDANAFLSVEAQPTAAVDRSRQVLLVWPQEAIGPPLPPDSSEGGSR